MRKFWNTSSGAFETSGNWTPTGVPGEGDLAFITATGSPYTVTTSTDVTVMGVSLSANATLDVTNSKTLTALEGTATGTNLGVIQIEAGSRFIFGGVLNNQNTITSAAGALTDFFVLGDTTLKGGGNFFLSDNANNTLRGFDTLTNVDNLIEGAGSITTDIVNKTLGTIEASSGGNQLVLAFSNVTNTGMLLGAGTAGLDIDGYVVTNIGGTIQAGALGFVYLEDGTKVIGGQVNTIGNGDIVVKNAIFDGSGTHPITHEGNLEVRPPAVTGDGLYIQGVINNQGVIALNAGAALFLGLPSSLGMDTTLQGGGQATLDNNSTIDLCSSTTLSKPLTLNNVDNTISGNGTIGSAATAASLVLNNEKLGIIDASNLNKVLLKLDDSGQIEFGGPTTTAVRFDDGSLTSLVLDDSVHFKGIISNFGKFNTAQTIDLLDIDSATGHLVSYAGGVLTIKDNEGHTAQLHFSGAYSLGSFNLNPDGHGGSVLTDPPAAPPPANAAVFGHYMAAAFAAGGNGLNGFAAKFDTFTQPLLAPTPHG